MKAVEDAEVLKIQQDILQLDNPILTDELRKLTPRQRYEAYRDNELTPESRSAMNYYRKAGLNLLEKQYLAEKKN